ncbi:MAG: LysR family transcriptional regulator [Coriobacteriia bacterium]|nr:LysR family transcriptional regulator [Coriobacteriia bacterium]
MNLSQLYYFQKLAELQHYTHAAEELFISQPTLSHAISSLEDDLGCKLFRKQGRNVRLTEDGATFKEYVDGALSILDDGVAALKIRQGRLSGTVQVGAIATVRADYLPALVLEYRRKRGNLIELRIEQGSTNELVEGLLEGKLDIALASTVNDPRISFTRLFDQSMGVIVQEGHPLASKEFVSLAELAEYEVYTYRADLPVGVRLDAFLRANGLEPNAMRLNRDSDDEVMLGGIVSREPVVGLCLLTSSLLPYRNLKVIPLLEPAARDLYAVGVLHLADAHLSPVVKDFLSHVESFPVSNQLLP